MSNQENLKPPDYSFFFAGIGSTTKYLLCGIQDQISGTVVSFLESVIKCYACKLTKILTDNSPQFIHKPGGKQRASIYRSV